LCPFSVSLHEQLPSVPWQVTPGAPSTLALPDPQPLDPLTPVEPLEEPLELLPELPTPFVEVADPVAWEKHNVPPGVAWQHTSG
jgi:hypothetical protein